MSSSQTTSLIGIPKDILTRIYDWFAALKAPDDKARTVQLGVHFEEISEMLMTMSSTSVLAQTLLTQALYATKNLADVLKANSESIVVDIRDRVEFLDSLCDQIVTATGTGQRFGLPMPRAVEEVARSNDSKFVDGRPLYNENGKVMKGPDYRPPNLAPFL